MRRPNLSNYPAVSGFSIGTKGAATEARSFLIHGSNASLQTWEPRVAEPGGTFRIISFDLPGHGLTGPAPSEDCSIEAMAEVVDRFPAEIGVDHVALAGNSMGGNISWVYTIKNPARVEALILPDAGGVPEQSRMTMEPPPRSQS